MACLCQIDWSATGSMLSGFAAWAGVGAIIWAAKQGRDAVSDWRAQKLIERQMDTGERTLMAAYKAKSALESIRSNFMSGSELSRAEQDLAANESELKAQPEERARRISFVQAIYNRVNATKEDWDEVFAVIPLVTAYFSEELAENLRTLIRQRSVVIASAEGYIDDHDGDDREFTRQLRADLFKGRDGEDPIVTKVDEAIAQLETTLLPLLRQDMWSQRSKSSLSWPSSKNG